MTAAAFILSWLSLHGYGPAQRDAVFVNARIESGLQPGRVSRQGGVGLWQWHGARRQALMAYARESGRAWTDPAAQLEFMDREWRAMPQAAGFFAAATRDDAWRIFCRHFERRACRERQSKQPKHQPNSGRQG
jgi:hypothetical protein